LPQVSVAHADGAAVAVAAPCDVPVGIDLEPLGRVDSDDVLTGAFTAEERRLLDGGGEGDVIRAWCAKEAAAKCLGTSLNGRPQAFALSRFSVQQPTAPALVSAFGHQITIAFAQWGNAVLAVAANALG
jgi:4'-phosphopantetheinyl transferase EntD